MKRPMRLGWRRRAATTPSTAIKMLLHTLQSPRAGALPTRATHCPAGGDEGVPAPPREVWSYEKTFFHD
jgi:hypothetical protein